jgi:hypothetical protein
MNFELPISTEHGFWVSFVLSIALSLALGAFLARYSSRLNFRWGTKRPKKLYFRSPRGKKRKNDGGS